MIVLIQFALAGCIKNNLKGIKEVLLLLPAIGGPVMTPSPAINEESPKALWNRGAPTRSTW